jgi:YHS domain-containing protein
LAVLPPHPLFGVATREDFMVKHRPRLTSAEEKRMRQWRGCGIVSLAVVLVLVGLYVALNFFHDKDHAHKPAPHGGVIVLVGDDENGHYHVEAVVEKGGLLKLYTFGGEVDQVLEVDAQTLTAHVKCERGGKTVAVELMPVPQPGDAEGKTSQFVGKLAEELRGKRLAVSVPGIVIGGKHFALDFAAGGPHGHAADVPAEEEEKLFLTPGGKYTEADIRANGNTTASAKYKRFKANHDVKPRPAEKICPVTRTKANPNCIWLVGGKTYEFCCPPCIDEFVRRAKTQPDLIREPDFFVKRK